MPYKQIIEHLYLGDQFANKNQIIKQLKVSDNFYDLFANLAADQQLVKTKKYVLTENVVALNLADSHDPAAFDNDVFAAGIKFLSEILATKTDVFVHCQLGLSRSPSIVFVYLVIKKIINQPTFSLALNEFIDFYYPYIKVNYGVYQYLKAHFPFQQVAILANKDWGEFSW